MIRRRAAWVAGCLLLGAASHAMECMEQPFEAMMEQADAIFSGKVAARDHVKAPPGRCWERSKENPDCGSKVATFDVGRVWKGEPGERVKVYSEDGCYCLGSYFNLGEEYLVFARKTEKGHGAGLHANNGCLGTRPLSMAEARVLIEKLDKEGKE